MMNDLDHELEEGPNNKGIAFALWIACIFGFCGIHRFYLGRWGSGLLWLCTFGLFGVGQFIDLLRLPAMVREENMKYAAFRALAERRRLGPMQQQHPVLPPGQQALPALPPAEPNTPEAFRRKLLEAAARYGGTLTVPQGVMATGKTFDEVEAELDSMTQSGHVGIDNDERTGAVIYTFGELSPNS